MRDRLIELINLTRDEYPNVPLINGCKPSFTEFLADYLLADGWTRLPCRIGELVLFKKDKKLTNAKIVKIIQRQDLSFRIYLLLENEEIITLSEEEFDKRVFLSLEEIEKELGK